MYSNFCLAALNFSGQNHLALIDTGRIRCFDYMFYPVCDLFVRDRCLSYFKKLA